MPEPLLLPPAAVPLSTVPSPPLVVVTPVVVRSVKVTFPEPELEAGFEPELEPEPESDAEPEPASEPELVTEPMPAATPVPVPVPTLTPAAAQAANSSRRMYWHVDMSCSGSKTHFQHSFYATSHSLCCALPGV